MDTIEFDLVERGSGMVIPLSIGARNAIDSVIRADVIKNAVRGAPPTMTAYDAAIAVLEKQARAILDNPASTQSLQRTARLFLASHGKA